MNDTYRCVFCDKDLQKYEARMAEFAVLFESDIMVDGVLRRAPTKRVECTYPLYACHTCIVNKSGILSEKT